MRRGLVARLEPGLQRQDLHRDRFGAAPPRSAPACCRAAPSAPCAARRWHRLSPWRDRVRRRSSRASPDCWHLFREPRVVARDHRVVAVGRGRVGLRKVLDRHGAERPDQIDEAALVGLDAIADGGALTDPRGHRAARIGGCPRPCTRSMVLAEVPAMQPRRRLQLGYVVDRHIDALDRRPGRRRNSPLRHRPMPRPACLRPAC